MNVWMVGRMLDDGTKQVVTDDAGNAKGFRTEDEAKQFIADGNLGPKSFAFERARPDEWLCTGAVNAVEWDCDRSKSR